MVTICPAVIAFVHIFALLVPLSTTSSSHFTVVFHPTVPRSGAFASLLRYQNQAHNWPHTVSFVTCVDFHVEMEFSLLTRNFIFIVAILCGRSPAL